MINEIAVSPDQARLATASTDRTVRLFDAATGDEVLVLRDVTAAMHGIAFSADGATLVGTALDGSLHLWRTTPERTVAAHRRLRAAVVAGAPLPDDTDANVVASFRAQRDVAHPTPDVR